MSVPIFPGLIEDLTAIIYELCDGQSRYMLSMVAKDWNVYCINKMNTIEVNKKSIKQNCKKHNILEIMRNYRKLNKIFVMRYACENNIKLLISIIIRLGNTMYDYGLYGACKGGHIDLVKHIFKICDSCSYNYGLNGACRGGFVDIVKYLIHSGAHNYNYGLSGACHGGHMDIVKYLIKLGVDDYNNGLLGACRGGFMDIVEYMIELGAYEYNIGLYMACGRGNDNIVKYLIKSGATSCGHCKKSMLDHLNR
jgi:hypothetical protein